MPVCIAAADDVQFLRDVAPILTQRCIGCHGPKKAEGGYRVHTFENLLSAGDSETAPIVPGKPKESELFVRISATDEFTRMPQQDDPLSPEQIDAVRRWIAEGAEFDGEDRASSLKSLLPPRVHPNPPQSYRVPVPVLALAFSPDGTELAIGGYHEVTVWNPATGELVRRLGRLPQRIHSLTWSRDGKTLLVGGGSPGDYGELALVDAASGERLRVFGTFEDVVLGAAFNENESRVAAGCADRTVHVYETETGKLSWESRTHADWVTAIAFSPDGRFLATSSRDMTVKVHDAATGTLFTTYTGHSKQYGQYAGRFAVYDVAFTPDEPTAITAGEGTVIQIWDPVKAKAESGTAGDMELRFAKESHTRYIEHGHGDTVFKLAVKGGQVFSASADGVVTQHDLASGKLLREYQGHTDWVFAVDFHPETQRAASGGYDGEVRIWNT
ncbi:MAG: c-type cytochrome domain-containing protein, partial [Planctomycetaceae bacterium]